MSRKIMIAPSVLSADFSILGEEIRKVVDSGADWLHIDIMDGVFVPNITIGPCVIKAIKKNAQVPFDVHLMIDNPVNHIEQFAGAGADIITFHIEACRDPRRTIAAIKDKGKKVGISIRPKTSISAISPFFDEIDMVLVMTVEPGFAGQKFMEDVVPKIKSIRDVFDKDIEVDGGINVDTARKVVDVGANVLVAGTAVFGEEDYRIAIRRLKGE